MLLDNRAFTREKLTKNRDSFYPANQLHNSSKVGQLAKSNGQLCRATKLSEKIGQLCCMSDIGLRVVYGARGVSLVR